VKGHVLEGGHFRQSPYLQETALHLGQAHIFAQSSELLERLSGIALSDKQIENLCHHYGQKIEDSEYNESAIPLKSEEWHNVMVDGSYILTRENKWCETKVGRVFKAEDNFLVSEKRAVIRQSEYVAHIGSHTDFIARFSPLLDRLNNFVFIGDGATWMWKWITADYPNAVQILDFFHAFEHICQWAILGIKNKKKRSVWLESIKILLLEDGLQEVMMRIQSIDCKGKALEDKISLLAYLKKNSHRMQYKTFLDQGYLIGSGAIESAQRTVVQQRLKRSGQRWTIKGGQQVLNLRTKALSNHWQDVTNLVRNAA